MSNNSNTYWTAFYTKPRNEKKAADRLSEQGYEVYCPTRSVVRQWSDRKKKVREPLFTSYLFAKVNEPIRMEILNDTSIVSSVFWLKKPVIIRELEIQGIKRFLDEYSDKESIKSFSLGTSATINAGPLKGELGEVIKIKGNKVVLQLTSLGLELKAELLSNNLILT